jgi:hypothetical protein
MIKVIIPSIFIE